jgi:hypothetical protein
MVTVVQSRFSHELEASAALVYQDQLLQLSTLRDDRHRKVHERAPIDGAIEASIRDEYEQLLSDLKQQIAQRQLMFGDIKRSVIDTVARKIEAAMSVTLELDPSGSHDDQTSLAAKNKNLLAELESESTELRRRVLKLRIVKCLSEISTTRFFRKRLFAVENDRKAAHSLLWSSRLDYESEEDIMETRITESSAALSELEIKIEKHKHEIEVEKESNGQGVQWKAKHLKTVDDLEKQLKKFSGIGDVNITRLLAELSERRSELDLLREEGAQFDKLTDDEVRRPMKVVEGVRGDIYDTRRAKAALLGTLREAEGIEAARGINTGRLLAENTGLKRTNQLLLDEITALESIKDRKASDVRHFMESTVAPPPPSIRSSAKAPGIIIRPLVLPKSLIKL